MIRYNIEIPDILCPECKQPYKQHDPLIVIQYGHGLVTIDCRNPECKIYKEHKRYAINVHKLYGKITSGMCTA